MKGASLKILILGGQGQLGTTLFRAFSLRHKILSPPRALVDISDFEGVKYFFEKNLPQVVINCTGFLDVPKAEIDRDSAEKINVKGVEHLAVLCAKHDVPLFHYSTDYVFDGALKRPYHEKDVHNSLNIYGQTKSMGEKVLKDTLKRHIIFRTCWLYSPFRRNFVNFILKANQERKDLHIVNDQIGSPTPASLLAQATGLILDQISVLPEDFYGTYHVASCGQASWYDFACEIKKNFQLGISLHPISTKEFNAQNSISVRRPSFSVLSSEKFSKRFHCVFPEWKDALRGSLRTDFL